MIILHSTTLTYDYNCATIYCIGCVQGNDDLLYDHCKYSW